MKIQCNACEAAEAKVLCCADDAALCWDCDEKVHAANKLAGKHQRVLLVPASSLSLVPKCDICQDSPVIDIVRGQKSELKTIAQGLGEQYVEHSRQEFWKSDVRAMFSSTQLVRYGLEIWSFATGIPITIREASGYFFCLEDRALFCRKCDIAMHATNPYVSAHRRYLLTGVQVGHDHADTGPCVAKSQANFEEVAVESYHNGSSSLPFSRGSIETCLPDWPLDDFFGFTAYNQNYGSPKADSGKIGSSDGSQPYFLADEEPDSDACFVQVPEIASPPTASGLHWHKRYRAADEVAFVPDICPSYNFGGNQSESKRRRRSMGGCSVDFTGCISS